MNIYTIYRKPNAKSEEDMLMLVPEGFSWWGLIFPLNILWALYHRSWLFCLLSTALLVFYAYGIQHPLPYEDYINTTKLPLQLFLGAFMYDFHRVSLTRRGYHFVDLVSGRNEEEALRNYLHSKFVNCN